MAKVSKDSWFFLRFFALIYSYLETQFSVFSTPAFVYLSRKASNLKEMVRDTGKDADKETEEVIRHFNRRFKRGETEPGEWRGVDAQIFGTQQDASMALPYILPYGNRASGMLVTGVTGILGHSICSALEGDVYYVVRGGVSNRRLPKGINPNRVIDGDITKPMCGLSLSDLKLLKDSGIGSFLHLAANVSFALTDADGSIWETNYVGTQDALALAKELGVRQFFHCSTAFADDERNPYEVSKKAAEGLVMRSGMKYSIFRPSAMVGDSQTGETADFNGYYGVYIYFHFIAEKARSENKDRVVQIPVYVVCSSDTTINLIPVDWVKYTMLALLKKGAYNEVYNLTHPNPPNARWVMERGFEILGISGVKCVDKPLSRAEKENLHKGDRMSMFIQKRVDLILDRYIPYVTFERRFSLETTKWALKEEFREPVSISAEFISLLLRYAVENNFGSVRGLKKKNDVNSAKNKTGDLAAAV